MINRKNILILLGLALAALLAWLFFNRENDDTNPQDQSEFPEIAILSNLIEQNPNNDSLLYLRAKEYYNLDAYDEALLDLNQAMRIDSMTPQYYHLLADVLLDYARPNDSRRAIEVLKLAAKRFPGRIPTLLKLSEFQLIVKKHGDALTTLDQILQQDPQNAEAFYMAGRVALDKNEYANAISSFQKSVNIDAGNEDAWLFLGRLYSDQNDERALQCFDNALRVDSSLLEAREYKGAYYKKQGQFEKAFEVYRDIIARNPDFANAYFDMGMMYLDMDSLAKAYSSYDIAIKTDPLFVKAYYWRGVASEKKGDLKAAYADYKQASGMMPDFEEAKQAKERLKDQGNK